ncbi:MAG TPA: radical SAM family heme chaperone HemW, partial [Flavitalea sp.]|nr:radical SAM family heme chaperone HemW [Flavitalea sp.]
MAGIYIHIPFCKKACTYCNFHFSTLLKSRNEFIDALLKEIRIRREYLGNQEIETIYFGGGTPSILNIGELKQIFEAIRSGFSIGPQAEITLEANPDDITDVKIAEWKIAGINRLSIGVQSFFESDLRWMNRAHSSQQAIDSIRLARAGGIDNLTIDLIFGTPGLTDDQWRENMETAVNEGVQHLSCYALTVEPHTALDHQIKKQLVPEIDSEQQARQFLIMADFLESKQFEQYEISNFALPGFRSRHNSSYWKGIHYLGLGPSAHSFNGKQRSWNIANNALYIQSLSTGLLNSETEELSESMKLNEYLMTALRTIEGISLADIESRFGLLRRIEIEEKSS